MRVLDIIRGTTVDGEGFRTAIYFAGCVHHCPGCHNPGSWDFHAGKEMTTEEIMSIIEEEDFNVTFSGGDPFCSAAQLIPLAEKIRERGYTIWAYTGYTIDQLREDPDKSQLLSLINVLVDGPYIESLRDPDLPFRGSSNQRIIRL